MAAPKLVVLLVVAALAGCASPPTSTRFAAQATEPAVLTGYDYGAGSLQRGNGTFRVDVDAATDSGSAQADFAFLGKAWRVTFAAFAQTRPFQEGGVRNDFPEHGPSGNGDALLPQIHALSAGWGTGTVTVDGRDFPDPATGQPSFNLHYMVTDTAPRDPSSLRVTKADGATPYDPASPGDAKVFPGVRQALLNVQSAGPAPPADVTLDLQDTLQAEPMYSRTFPVLLNASAGINVNLTVLGTGPLPPTGRLTFTLAGPDGAALGRFTYDPATPMAPNAGVIQHPDPLPAGNYSLQVEGTGAGMEWRAQVHVDHASPMFLHVVFTNVTVG